MGLLTSRGGVMGRMGGYYVKDYSMNCSYFKIRKKRNAKSFLRGKEGRMEEDVMKKGGG